LKNLAIFDSNHFKVLLITVLC